MRSAETVLRSLQLQADFATAEAGRVLQSAVAAVSDVERALRSIEQEALAIGDEIRHLLSRRKAINVAAIECLKVSLRTARLDEIRFRTLLQERKLVEAQALESLTGLRHRASGLRDAVAGEARGYASHLEAAESAERADLWLARRTRIASCT